MPTMLILGASSDIAHACAVAFAREGWDLCLAGRNMDELQSLAQDIHIRTEKNVSCVEFDALDTAGHQSLWENLSDKTDAVLCSVGLLGDQEQARHDHDLADRILRTNFTGLVPLLSMAADTFERRGSGLIIGISSVAGDRGRASNYMYGSAKAGFSAFLSGLRNRLARKGVHVITVKPGFVATSMTEGMDLPARLTATPEQVASDVVRAVNKKKDVVYTRWFWRGIMLVIKHIPEGVFKKGNL